MNGSLLTAAAGFTSNGLPYNRRGEGPRTAVLFPGLSFENRPLKGMETGATFGFFKTLRPEYTLYALGRKRALPTGYSPADMADDYASGIAHEFEGPVDVIGTSTGGSLALQFAADHGELVRRLVIHSAAYRLGPPGREAQLRVRDSARDRKWREAWAVLMELGLRPSWYRGAAVAVGSALMARSAPDDPSDLIVTIEAEDAFDLRDRLADITASTLVIAGAADPFYTEDLFRETARGIPGARLVLYPGMGHPARGKPFGRELREFLLGE